MLLSDSRNGTITAKPSLGVLVAVGVSVDVLLGVDEGLAEGVSVAVLVAVGVSVWVADGVDDGDMVRVEEGRASGLACPASPLLIHD